MAPIAPIIDAQKVIAAYDFVKQLAVTTGIVKSDNNKTIPIIRIAITIVIATTIDIM